MKRIIRLGVNIDHVATLRQARKEGIPSLLRAAQEVEKAGADSITIHLREDRRHIQDQDVLDLAKTLKIPMNLEMSLSPQIIRFALKVKPEMVCLVPEKRQELTTEGGLDLFQKNRTLNQVIKKFVDQGIQPSLFIDPTLKQIREAARLGAPAIELHTGSYANAKGSKKTKEFLRIKKASKVAKELGLQVHAGHGLDYENTKRILTIPEIEELNIGYAMVCESVFVGLGVAVKRMKNIIRSSAR